MAKAHATRRSAQQSKTTPSSSAAASSSTSRGADRGASRYSSKTANKETVSAKPNVRTIHEDDEELNSGFGGYMSSSSGQNMLKLFILGNTLLILVTFAWPHIRDTAAAIRSLMLE